MGLRSKIDDNIKSGEFQEILGAPAGILIRWGISIILMVLIIVVTLSSFIRFPEVIRARLTLTSYNPPASIIARSAGRITLLVSEGELVETGTYLGIIESSAISKDILTLTRYFDEHKVELLSFNPELIQIPENLKVGELQMGYLSLLKNLKLYALFNRLNYFGRQINEIQHQIELNVKLSKQIEKQNRLAKEEFDISTKKLKIDSSLFAERVIAELDFDKTRSTHLLIEKTYELTFQNITSNQIRINELISRIGELSLERDEKISTFKNEIFSSFEQLESQLKDWEQKYLLKAPIKGKVSFFKYRNDNQFINLGEEVMKVIADSNNIYGELLLPLVGSGKVEIGQRVNIKLDNYPFHEYGILVGRILSISSLPKENMYSIQVKLPKDLITTYKKHLPFKQEMQGNAEIITKDITITDRILNQFKKLIGQSTFSSAPAQVE